MCILQSFLILCFIFFGLAPAWSWNEDYSDIPISSERTVCLPKISSLSSGIVVHSNLPDEACPPGEVRFKFVVGKEPKDSWGLILDQVAQDHFPPPGVAWPVKEPDTSPRLWHFTCYQTIKVDRLGFMVTERAFRGEITTSAKEQSCTVASLSAEKICQESWGGNEIYEKCEGAE